MRFAMLHGVSQGKDGCEPGAEEEKAASLKRISVTEGFAMEMVSSGERCFSMGVQEQGTTMKKFYGVC